MSRLNEKQVTIARVYSLAMLDLAEAKGTSESLLEEMRDLLALLEKEPSFAEFFASPLVDRDERRRAFEKIFRGRASDLLVDSLQILNRKKRLAYWATIVELYRRELQGRQGRIDVQVTSAVPLTDDQRRSLSDAVRKKVGREPDLAESVDPSLIGGMVVRIGDEKVDTSLAKDLRTVSHLLQERAVREILGDHSVISG